MEQYSIRLECFEGPMDLLMHLIEKNKINIYDIPIASLTEQYMGYLDKMREFNMEIASEFIIMAATLLQIKSRMLLPKPPKKVEEEEIDPRQELIDRILEYRRFKEVSTVLSDMQEKQEYFFAREPMELPQRHLPPAQLSLNELLEAFKKVMTAKVEAKIPQVLVEPEVFSVEDKMELLLSLLNRLDGKMLFSDAFNSDNSKSELITTFLAMLELIKLKSIVVMQDGSFEEIYISIRVRDEAENINKAGEE